MLPLVRSWEILARPRREAAAENCPAAGKRRGREVREIGEGGEQEFLALERELAVLLRRARASSGEMAREVHPELEPAAYGLLVRLAETGRQRATDLAAYFGVGKATMSRQLRALDELGLIIRTPDPADGRASLVELTEEGGARFSRVRDARRAQYVRKLVDWDREEIAELARLLNQLNTSMGG
ncbi:MarR family winged helix-turn-helix transcriptional regulator [Streptomyces sp. NPDC052396]|uniref:MarR family winged helix-turn-helix transcriptional regulator n=1 Tax=Streptomyces sp. NPDC052396 TaxID=3365689 RepID=UPI0037CCC39C